MGLTKGFTGLLVSVFIRWSFVHRGMALHELIKISHSAVGKVKRHKVDVALGLTFYGTREDVLGREVFMNFSVGETHRLNLLDRFFLVSHRYFNITRENSK